MTNVHLIVNTIERTYNMSTLEIDIHALSTTMTNERDI